MIEPPKLPSIAELTSEPIKDYKRWKEKRNKLIV